MKQVLKSTPANRLQSVTEQYEIGDILFLIGAGIVTPHRDRSNEESGTGSIGTSSVGHHRRNLHLVGLIVLNKLVGDRLGDLTGQSDGPLDFDTESDDEGTPASKGCTTLI